MKTAGFILCLVFSIAMLPTGAWSSPQIRDAAVGQLEVHFNPLLQPFLRFFGLPEWLPICTATQIEDRIVVTASHCIPDDAFYMFSGGGGAGPDVQALRFSRRSGLYADSLAAYLRRLPSGATPLQYGSGPYPVIDGFRVGFYRGTLGHVYYRDADVLFSGFRLTDDLGYPLPDRVVPTQPSDPLYQVDIAVLTLRDPWPAVHPVQLGPIPRKGDEACSTGFSVGLRQWSGCSTVTVPLTYLDGYGWVTVLGSEVMQWAPGASGSLVTNPLTRKTIGILTLGGPPGFLGNFVGVVPSGLLWLALERAGVR
jgi:hypothetical protein